MIAYAHHIFHVIHEFATGLLSFSSQLVVKKIAPRRSRVQILFKPWNIFQAWCFNCVVHCEDHFGTWHVNKENSTIMIPATSPCLTYHFTVTSAIFAVSHCHYPCTVLAIWWNCTITVYSCYANCVYTVDVAIKCTAVFKKESTISYSKDINWSTISATLVVETISELEKLTVIINWSLHINQSQLTPVNHRFIGNDSE